MLPPPGAVFVALWTATTAFIYLGVEELGAQVEQPFAILPLWQLCRPEPRTMRRPQRAIRAPCTAEIIASCVMSYTGAISRS